MIRDDFNVSVGMNVERQEECERSLGWEERMMLEGI